MSNSYQDVQSAAALEATIGRLVYKDIVDMNGLVYGAESMWNICALA